MRAGGPVPDGVRSEDAASAVEVEDSPPALLDLLWLREACGLRPSGVDLPPLLADPPPPARRAPDPATLRTWSLAWPIVWDEVLAHTARARPADAVLQMADLPRGSDELRARIKDFLGPAWRDRFGDEVFQDDGYLAWAAADADRQVAHHLGLARSLESDVVDAMRSARSAGLEKVVTIPCREPFSRVIGAAALLVSGPTRDDAVAYRAALALFAEDAPLLS